MLHASYPRSDDTDLMEKIKDLEARRLQAMRTNDPETLGGLLSSNMVYIHESGRLYRKAEYIRAIQTRDLSYHEDVAFEDEEVQIRELIYLATGVMRGHGLLDGERLVFHVRYLAIWALEHDQVWRLISVQKTPIAPGPFDRPLFA